MKTIYLLLTPQAGAKWAIFTDKILCPEGFFSFCISFIQLHSNVCAHFVVSWISLSIGLTTTLTQVRAWCQTHDNHYLHHVWLFTGACLAHNCTTIRAHALPWLDVLLNQLRSALLYSFWFSHKLSISCSDIRYVSFVELLHNIQSKIWPTYLICLAHTCHAELRRI